jgi:hypothetical protein
MAGTRHPLAWQNWSLGFAHPEAHAHPSQLLGK